MGVLDFFVRWQLILLIRKNNMEIISRLDFWVSFDLSNEFATKFIGAQEMSFQFPFIAILVAK